MLRSLLVRKAWVFPFSHRANWFQLGRTRWVRIRNNCSWGWVGKCWAGGLQSFYLQSCCRPGRLGWLHFLQGSWIPRALLLEDCERRHAQDESYVCFTRHNGLQAEGIVEVCARRRIHLPRKQRYRWKWLRQTWIFRNQCSWRWRKNGIRRSTFSSVWLGT